MRRLSLIFVSLALFMFSGPHAVYGQTGKISGTVTDSETGDPLPGVNVVIEGTNQGATTNAEGFYNILNVSPGTYTLRASFVGYAEAVVEEVNVNPDLTTTIDFQLQEEAVGLDEVVVQSETPVVQPDVSANVANVSMEEMENIPVTSVDEVIGMQAGVEGNLSIRGSGADEMDFIVDGMSMRNPRDNTPFTGISYTSVEQVQVQTGGFNAEYGNVRSGVVNVTTKEGPRDSYTTDVIARYQPASKKYFGPLPNAGINEEVPPEEMAYWIRPHLDPEVRMQGTSQGWDRYTRRQYHSFRGWEAVAEEYKEDPERPDLTPEQLIEQFKWYYRKDVSPQAPDYTFDGSIGGPVPVVSNALGNLRFFGSYRQTQNAYLVPQSRNAYSDRMGNLKLTSNVSQGIKLSLTGMYAKQLGLGSSQSGWGGIYEGTGSMASDLETIERRKGIFANHQFPESNITRSQVGLEATHTVSPNTFYNVRLQRNSTSYETGPDPDGHRDYSIIHSIGDAEYDEAPFGFHNAFQVFAPSGFQIGGNWSEGRDSSDVALWIGGVDITSQLTPYSQLKTGADFNYTDYNAAHEQVDPTKPSVPNPDYYWHRKAAQGAAYAQNKLEFQGMIANVGLRVDYFQPQGEWYDHDTFERGFASNDLESIEQARIEGQFHWSPRLGISFPVTTNSKLYFNYGHFRNIQQMHQLFMVREVFGKSKIDFVGNPNLPMTKTVAYELGYDQNLYDMFLLRVTGYYKSQSDQPRSVQFRSLDGRVSYYKYFPLNYGDVRGLEFSLRKNRGQWIRGFANYTYMVEKAGNFGYDDIYENRQDMRNEIRLDREFVSKPIPEPFAKFHLEFLTPPGFGPEIGGGHLLGDWRLSFFGQWRAGDTFTWDGNTNVQVQNNLQWGAYKMVDMRLSKNVETALGRAQLFVDVSNVFNIRNMNRSSAFNGRFDYEHYLMSLHLPEDTFEDVEDPYLWPYGSDKPGDYRSRDVEFVPIETVRNLPDEGLSREGHYGPLYYVKSEEQYYIWDGSSFEEPDSGKLDQVLEDKAYIDMPNSQYLTFLNPRQLQFGIRITL